MIEQRKQMKRNKSEILDKSSSISRFEKLYKVKIYNIKLTNITYTNRFTKIKKLDQKLKRNYKKMSR